MPPSARAQVRRVPKRADYDRGTINAILDESLYCHIAFLHEGSPAVIPTTFVRDGGRILIHGSSASRMMKALAGGGELCLCVTLFDGLVLARSAYHHSANYRSVVLYGRATEIDEPNAKMEGFRLFVEKLLPRRWDDIRPPNDAEMRATLLLSVPVDEASAKVRTGPPADDEEDQLIPAWAGVLPFQLVPGTPQPDIHTPVGTPLPEAFERFFAPSFAPAGTHA